MTGLKGTDGVIFRRFSLYIRIGGRLLGVHVCCVSGPFLGFSMAVLLQFCSQIVESDVIRIKLRVTSPSAQCALRGEAWAGHCTALSVDDPTDYNSRLRH